MGFVSSIFAKLFIIYSSSREEQGIVLEVGQLGAGLRLTLGCLVSYTAEFMDRKDSILKQSVF